MAEQSRESKWRRAFDDLATFALLACAVMPGWIIALVVVGLKWYGGADGLLPWPWWICLASSVIGPFVLVLVRIKLPEAPIVWEEPVEMTETVASQPIEEGIIPGEFGVTSV